MKKRQDIEWFIQIPILENHYPSQAELNNQISMGGQTGTSDIKCGGPKVGQMRFPIRSKQIIRTEGIEPNSIFSTIHTGLSENAVYPE